MLFVNKVVKDNTPETLICMNCGTNQICHTKGEPSYAYCPFCKDTWVDTVANLLENSIQAEKLAKERAKEAKHESDESSSCL